jgi:hypothetical protein
MRIRCRARIADDCYHDRECVEVYGDDSMSGDGTFDGESVVCDACYITGGQSALLFSAHAEGLVTRYVERVDRAEKWREQADKLDAYAARCRREGLIKGPGGAEDAEEAASGYRRAADRELRLKGER